MNAVAQVVVAVLLILVQVVLEVAEVLHLPVRLVLLVIRVRPEPLLGAVVQDQLIVVVVQNHHSNNCPENYYHLTKLENNYVKKKKISVLIALGMLMIAPWGMAQTIYDGAKLTGKDLNEVITSLLR